ncbi:hypothetical protein CVD28_14110 [Bacillus sp. M6-12]|uniref:sensor histidine kinase n=1 Tax=Bacillus sp. M6-12 TaxID=2054166 RepID=UPI000C7843FF|nr:GHKL domain-containing protein [Bacillus sp. M6-12]PLS17182.1 hypothetical protein CVD28_14110 [Bacillus sp. M6-12]
MKVLILAFHCLLAAAAVLKGLPALLAAAIIIIMLASSAYLYKRLPGVPNDSFSILILSLLSIGYLLSRPVSIITLFLICLLVFEFQLAKRSKDNKLVQAELETLKREMSKENELFYQIRAQRHDFIKHANTIHYLLESDQPEKARKYLEEYLGELGEITASIKGEEAHIAAMLHQIAKQASMSKIKVTLHTEVPLSSLPLPDVSQINLLLNLLDNSLEAACQSLDKNLRISSSIHSGIYVLEVVNSTAKLTLGQQEALFREYGLTNKGGNHEGLGTWIVKEIVEKHSGRLEYKYENSCVSIKMKFPVIKGAKAASI